MVASMSWVYWPFIDLQALRDYSRFRIHHVQKSSEEHASLVLVAEESEVVSKHEDSIELAQGWPNIVDRHEPSVS